VKKKDLLGIVNHKRQTDGKKLLKSATTVWDRSRPRNTRSIQAKQHLGKGLFCTSKSPKAEDKDNESTHYQRAHVKNIKLFLFKDDESTKYSLLHSMDDKAYVRPGTSEGCEKARRIKILNLANEGAKQLPKYDWPETMVYQTPSAHRIMTKRAMNIGSEITTLVDDDNHFVVVRPKAFVDSSGTTWASEIIRLRTMHPAVFEIPLASDNTSFSAEQRGSLCKIEYATFQYLDMTEEEDVKKVSAHDDCPHRKYERNRVQHLLSKINNAGHIEHDADNTAENVCACTKL
jgi:hypothetical protein